MQSNTAPSVYAAPTCRHPYGTSLNAGEVIVAIERQHTVRSLELKRLDSYLPQSPRLSRLRQEIRTSPVVSKDASCRPAVFHMGYPGREDRCSWIYIERMTKLGIHYGFAVHVAYDPRTVTFLDAYNMAGLVRAYGNCVFFPQQITRTGANPWSEDQGSFNESGGTSSPPWVKADFFDSELRREIYVQRVARWRERQGKIPAYIPSAMNSEHIRKSYPEVEFQAHGTVASYASNQEQVARASSANIQSQRTDFCFLEGGNVLPGRRADGTPFAVVGADSLAVSQRLIEVELGNVRSVSDLQIKQLMAIDLGLPDAADVIVVEQPAAFHLDMKVLLLGDGVAIVNDAVAAYEMERHWLLLGYNQRLAHRCDVEKYPERLHTIQLSHVRQNALFEKGFEDATAADLERQGISVIRKAFVFPISEMNFCNGEMGTSESGDTFFITNGGTPEAQDYVSAFFGEHNIAVHFVGRRASIQSLQLKGGAGCRVKAQV